MCYICESINIHTLLQVKAQHGATRIQTGHSTTNGKDEKYLSFDGMVLEDLAELEDLVDPTHWHSHPKPRSAQASQDIMKPIETSTLW